MLENFKKAMELEQKRKRDLSNMTAAKKKVGYKSEDEESDTSDLDDEDGEDGRRWKKNEKSSA